MNRRINSALERATKLSGSLLSTVEDDEVVLGIDASLTKTGVSVFGLRSKMHTSMVFKPKHKSIARLEEIYRFTRVLVGGLDRAYWLRHIVLENYAMGIKGGQTFSIGEGGGAVKLALLHELGDTEIAYPTLVAPTALKKFVTGKGNGDKNAILLAAYKKWGVDFSDSDDKSDAYALARVGAAIILGETEHAYEAEVVASLERHTGWQT